MLVKLFNGSLILAIAYLVYSIIVLILFFKFILKGKEKVNWTILSFSFLFIIVQAYLWVIWTSYCVFTVKYFINSPAVTHSWLYYIAGFCAALFLLTLLDNAMQGIKSRYNLNLSEQFQLIVFGVNTYVVVIVLSFILFSVFPNLMSYKYVSFINNWIY